jgi:hypothetical protein
MLCKHSGYFTTPRHTIAQSSVPHRDDDDDDDDDGDSVHLWKVCKLLPDYTAQHPSRRLSPYFSPWEPEIVHK